MLEGHLEVAQLLFAYGADISSRSEDNQTPLHIATQKGHPEVGKWLLNCGADVNSWGMDGRAPLHHAAGNDDIEAARILLERNAEVNARDDDGFTPFLRASESGSTDVLRLLLHNNADGHVHDNIGTPHCISQRSVVPPILLVYYLNTVQNRREFTLLSASTNGHVGNSPSGWITIPMSTLTTGE